MMVDLSGKVALVTGAASPFGLGFSAARKMAEQGARVVITDVDTAVYERARELASGCRETRALIQDVTLEESWERTIREIVESSGRLDVLVNNAGIVIIKEIADLTKADWERQITVNLNSMFLGCKAAIAQMRRQRSGGSIVNISSIAALVGAVGAAGYAASKGGIRAATKAIAIECAKDAIRVNSVHPGMIMTDIHRKAMEQDGALYEQIMASAGIPLGHLGEPDDVGAMVAFLASEDANYITGGEFVIDGGLVAAQ